MEDMLNVAEAKTRLIQELSEITGFKYLKSGVLKKTVKDIVFEINFFSSKWNESGQSIEINAELRLIYKTYGKLPVDNVVASMSYQPENTNIKTVLLQLSIKYSYINSDNASLPSLIIRHSFSFISTI